MDPDPPFRVQRRRRGDAVVVGPEGEIDLAVIDVLRVELEAALEEAPTVVLDLRAVSFLDSTGLRLIVELQHRAEDAAVALVVVRGAEAVQRLLDVVGLSSRLTLVDDVGEGVAGGRGEPR
jgi:anti-sigma B factor antagonist